MRREAAETETQAAAGGRHLHIDAGIAVGVDRNPSPVAGDEVEACFAFVENRVTGAAIEQVAAIRLLREQPRQRPSRHCIELGTRRFGRRLVSQALRGAIDVLLERSGGLSRDFSGGIDRTSRRFADRTGCPGGAFLQAVE